MTAPIVLAAGGTGGHIFPAQALAAALIRRGRRVVLVTDQRRGRSMADGFPDVEILSVRSGTPTGRNWIGKIRAFGDLALGTFEALRLQGRLKPAAVVGFGGYPSLPSALAAVIGGVPLCLHEQNAVLGRVNKLIVRRAALVATSFAEVSGIPAGLPVVLTGNPVRGPIAEMAGRPYAPPRADGPIEILVFGGSQGARIFSDAVPEALSRLPQATRARLRVTQQVRAEDLDRVRAVYGAAGVTADLRPFLSDMPERLAAAHLVISRGGASTIAELIAVGRPALVAPYPHHKDRHQLANAMNMVKVGAGWVLPDALMTPEALALKVATLIATPDKLAQAAEAARRLGRLDAADALADAVERLAPGGGSAPAATRAHGSGALMREIAR